MTTRLINAVIRAQLAVGHVRDKGATALEYALLIGLIAVIIVAAVTLLGTRLNTNFNNVATRLPTAAP